MERSKTKLKDAEIAKELDFIFQNALGNPIMFDEEPTAAQIKPNTIGKVKDANDYLFVKLSDGKTVKIATTEVT